MKRYNILVIINHDQLQEGDSFYKLFDEVKKSELSQSVLVTSIGSTKNQVFLEDKDCSLLFGKYVDNELKLATDGTWYLDNERIDILDFDVIFIRLDHPIPQKLLKKLCLLENKKIIINSPTGILNTSTKEYLMNFKDVCPYQEIHSSLDSIINISNRFPVVVKPVKQYGGKGIVKLDIDGSYIENQKIDRDSALNLISQHLKEDSKVIVMEFLRRVNEGDKRTIVVNGTIIGSILRKPKPGSWLCNLSQGGQAVAAKTDPNEINIIKKINPTLANEGIIIYGIDTLIDNQGERVLTEINTANVGGFLQIEGFSQENIFLKTVNELFDFVKKQDS